MFTIYLLRDPDAPEVGYVGQTRHVLERRVRQHVTNAGRWPTRAVCVWLMELSARGVTPAAQVLETCDTAAAANEAERRWIRWCRKGLRMHLVNSTAGGQSVYGPTFSARLREAMARPETRERKRVASRAVAARTWADPAVAERRREGVRRNWQTPERQQRARDAWADPARRAERGRAISAAHQRPETRERNRAANKAKANRPEQKAVVSATLRGLWADPEHRATRGAAIAESLRRKHATDPEYREKQAARLREQAKRAAETRWARVREGQQQREGGTGGE